MVPALAKRAGEGVRQNCAVKREAQGHPLQQRSAPGGLPPPVSAASGCAWSKNSATTGGPNQPNRSAVGLAQDVPRAQSVSSSVAGVVYGGASLAPPVHGEGGWNRAQEGSRPPAPLVHGEGGWNRGQGDSQPGAELGGWGPSAKMPFLFSAGREGGGRGRGGWEGGGGAEKRQKVDGGAVTDGGDRGALRVVTARGNAGVQAVMGGGRGAADGGVGGGVTSAGMTTSGVGWGGAGKREETQCGAGGLGEGGASVVRKSKAAPESSSKLKFNWGRSRGLVQRR